MSRGWAVALAACAFLFASPAIAVQSEPLVQTVEEHDNARGEIDKRAADFLHRSSGYSFPLSLGEMPARKTVTYGPGDASVYYTLYGGGNDDAWLDLYVYPAQLTLDDEVAEIEAAIAGKGITQRVPRPVGLPALPGSRDGWFEGAYDGLPLNTGYRVMRVGDWYIKARLSIPKAGGAEAIARGMNGLSAIPWSIPDSKLATEGRAVAAR